jgi:hypothetical protein
MVQFGSMKKSEAIDLLGGSVRDAASALEVSYQAVDKWPDELPRRIADRVLGAWTRIHQPGLVSKEELTQGVSNAQPAEQGVV